MSIALLFFFNRTTDYPIMERKPRLRVKGRSKKIITIIKLQIKICFSLKKIIIKQNPFSINNILTKTKTL